MLQVKWGIDLASEHERYLTEQVFKQPLIVYDYPKEIKVLYLCWTATFSEAESITISLA